VLGLTTAREGLDNDYAATAAWAWLWQSARLIGFGGGIDIMLRCALRHGEQLASTSDIGSAVFAVGEKRINSPRYAKRRSVGVALIPEDRKTEGLVLPLSVRENISLASIGRFARGGFISTRSETEAVEAVLRTLSIHAHGADVPVATLSGGNQQKVVIAKWLLTNANLILLNDPTRGIDVGTKQEIYTLLRKLAGLGKGILFYSTDHAELIGCCDRVVILFEGRIVRELAGDDMTEQEILRAAFNLPEKD
jgi:ribose transport system ATP-binding protein